MDKTSKKAGPEPVTKKLKKDKASTLARSGIPNAVAAVSPTASTVKKPPAAAAAVPPPSSLPKPEENPFKLGIQLRDKLQSEWAKSEGARDMTVIGKYLDDVKLILIKMKFLEKSGHDIPTDHEILVRDILEIGVMYSVLKPEPDMAMFNSYVSQLKSYYYDYGVNIPMSLVKYEVLGSYLVYLLSESRLGEFHVEVERILHPIETSAEIMENPFIRRAIELERALEEGRYSQIHAEDGPQMYSKVWCYFLRNLITGTRVQIAETLEVAYDKLTLTAAMDRLKFKDKADFTAFATGRQWKLVDGAYHFNRGDASEDDFIPAQRLVGDFVGYARELESII